MSSRPTQSEIWFDRYVRQHGHDPGVGEPDLGSQRRPDRLIRWNGHEVVCEIKEFAQDVVPASRGVGAIALERWYGAVRGQVHAAARQMRELADSGLPLVAVLANPQGMFVPLAVDEVIAALYGNPQIVMTIDQTTGASVGEPQLVAGPDGEIRNDHRYLSAVVLLRHGDRHRDWTEGLPGQPRGERGGNAKPLPEAIARVQELERLACQEEASGKTREGNHFRTDVIVTASPDAASLPHDVFEGPLDTRWELDRATGLYTEARARTGEGDHCGRTAGPAGDAS